MKKVCLILSLTALFASCATDSINEPTPIVPDEEENGYWTGPEFTSEYKSDPNGVYSLRNVQKALDILAGEGLTRAESITLEPTHHYVRFLPQSEADISILHDSLDLDIFHYPFDRDLTPEEREAYLDTEINGYGWQYSLVEPDFEMPTGIKWELLDYAYLQPDDEETITRSGESYQLPADVYSSAIDKSMEITGMGDDTPATRAGKWQPSGLIRACTITNNPTPLPGVYVRANTTFNTGNTISGTDGKFTISRGKGGAFRNKVHYMVIWYRDGRWNIHDSAGKADTKRSGDQWIKAPWNPIFANGEDGFCASIHYSLYNWYYVCTDIPKFKSSINVRERHGDTGPSNLPSTFDHKKRDEITIYGYGKKENGNIGQLSNNDVIATTIVRLFEMNEYYRYR